MLTSESRGGPLATEFGRVGYLAGEPLPSCLWSSQAIPLVLTSD